MRIRTVSFFFLFFLAAAARAEEDTPSESAAQLMAPPPAGRPAKVWEGSLAAQWMPAADVTGAGGELSLYEARGTLGRSFRLDPRLRLSPELSYAFFRPDAPSFLNLPDTLHTVSVGLRADYARGGRSSLSLLVAPSLAGDFRRVTGGDLKVRYGVTGRYAGWEKLTLIGGLIYQQGYHSNKFLPILGAIYRPDPRWTVSIAAPRPQVSYAMRPDLRLNMGMEFSSGEFQLHEESLGANVMRYRDLRVLGGVDFPVGGLKAELAGGYAFNRNFQFYERFAAVRPDLKVDDGPFLRAGLKGEW